jgi:hypothetical protein
MRYEEDMRKLLQSALESQLRRCVQHYGCQFALDFSTRVITRLPNFVSYFSLPLTERQMLCFWDTCLTQCQEEFLELIRHPAPAGRKPDIEAVALEAGPGFIKLLVQGFATATGQSQASYLAHLQLQQAQGSLAAPITPQNPVDIFKEQFITGFSERPDGGSTDYCTIITTFASPGSAKRKSGQEGAFVRRNFGSLSSAGTPKILTTLLPNGVPCPVKVKVIPSDPAQEPFVVPVRWVHMPQKNNIAERRWVCMYDPAQAEQPLVPGQYHYELSEMCFERKKIQETCYQVLVCAVFTRVASQ